MCINKFFSLPKYNFYAIFICKHIKFNLSVTKINEDAGIKDAAKKWDASYSAVELQSGPSLKGKAWL